jgi:hypothetical protein
MGAWGQGDRGIEDMGMETGDMGECWSPSECLYECPYVPMSLCPYATFANCS